MSGAALHAGAQTQVQVYARLNLSVERVDAGGAAARPAQTRISNNRSVLGLRGREDLGAGLAAVFQVEGTLSPDTGAGEIARRDTRIGLEGGFGTLFLGHWSTAYNGATSSLDPFYPTTAGYVSILANGSAAAVDNLSNSHSFDRRQANSLHYWSKPWRGLSLRLTHGAGEERPASGARPSLNSGALVYEQGAWYGALAHERHRDYQGPGLDDSGTKVGLAYRFGATRVAAMAERLRYQTAAGALARKAWYVSLTHQIGPHGLRAGLARAGDGRGARAIRVGSVRGGPDTGAFHLTLGYDYALSTRTSIYAYVTRLDNEGAASYDFAINGLDAGAGATLDATAFGLRHSF